MNHRGDTNTIDVMLEAEDRYLSARISETSWRLAETKQRLVELEHLATVLTDLQRRKAK